MKGINESKNRLGYIRYDLFEDEDDLQHELPLLERYPGRMRARLQWSIEQGHSEMKEMDSDGTRTSRSRATEIQIYSENLPGP